MQCCSAGKQISLQGVIEGYGELAKSEGHCNTRKKNVEFILFATKFLKWILLKLIVTLSCHLRAQQQSMKLCGTQLCLWETGAYFRKPVTHSAELLTKAIRDWVVSIWVDCWKASLGGRTEVTKLPFRNKTQFNPRNFYCISIIFTAVMWVL